LFGLSENIVEGFDILGILAVFNAGVKIKPQLPMSRDRGFYFCDKAEDGQKNSFAKPSHICLIKSA
jgi:hypothetical protein